MFQIKIGNKEFVVENVNIGTTNNSSYINVIITAYSKEQARDIRKAIAPKEFSYTSKLSSIQDGLTELIMTKTCKFLFERIDEDPTVNFSVPLAVAILNRTNSQILGQSMDILIQETSTNLKGCKNLTDAINRLDLDRDKYAKYRDLVFELEELRELLEIKLK